MNQTIHQTSQYEVIRQLRLPLIILVTFAHSYGAVRQGYSLIGEGWDSYEVLKLLVSQTLVKVVVPVFFVISGYLFFRDVEQWDWQQYRGKLWRRAKTLLLPYLVWNLVWVLVSGFKIQDSGFTFPDSSSLFNAFWIFNEQAGMQTDWFGCEHWMTAPANLPLWFLRDLIVVTILTPLIYIGLRKCGWWLMGLLTIVYLSGVCPFIPGLSAYAIYFFSLGAMLSLKRLDLVETSRKVIRPVSVLAICLMIGMVLTYHTPVFSSLMLCFRLVSVPVVFCLFNAQFIMHHAQGSMLNAQAISSSSYFLYLTHYVFFFSFIDRALFALLGTQTFGLCLHYLLAPLIKAALLIGIYVVYKRLVKAIHSFTFTQ